MIDLDELLLFAGLGGVAVQLVGIFIANIAVYKMQRAINEREPSDRRISPWRVIGKGSFTYHPVLKYEKQFEDGPLSRLRSFADWLIWPGLVVGLGCLVIEKTRH